MHARHVGGAPDTEALAITVTNSAVPAAPATCCRVVMIALPCAYNRSGSAASASVISGVNISARPIIMTVWITTSSHTGVVADSNANPHSATNSRIEPGTTSGRAPYRS